MPGGGAAVSARRFLGLSRAQLDALRVIDELVGAAGFAPSYGEVAAEMGVCKSNVARYVAALEARGWLARSPHAARSLVVLRRPPALIEGPVGVTGAGRAAVDAGRPEATR